MVPTDRVPEVAAEEVADDAHLLDVREDDEWTAGHAPGAQHVPMRQVPARLAEVPTDREVVVVCRAGVRSAQVVSFLLDQGYTQVRNLTGGMHEWAHARRPLVSEQDTPPAIR